jgi:hypothetical protein
MMKTAILLFFLILTNAAFAQFAIIQDKDGYCNVRSAPGKGNNIIDTLRNGHFTYALDTTGNWTNIDYSKGKTQLHGQVYSDRVKFISLYPAIPVLAEKGNEIVLSKDSIKIVIKAQKFNRSNYKLTFNKEYKDQLELVNNKQYWGTDGGIPQTVYKSVEVSIGSRKFSLPQTAIENLFEISLYNTVANYDSGNDVLYIQAINSDGAGAYQVIWKVEKGQYKERFVAFGF